MDKIAIGKFKCSKHPNKQLQFIQVNDLLSSPNQQKPLFYCSSCFNHDLSFQATNYLMIDQIISEAHNSIIPKWPPVNDYQIIQDLFEFTQNQSQIDYEKQITQFFDQLKKEFLDKIDIIQKKMINQAQKNPTNTLKTLQKYQEISKILDFQQLLTNHQSNNLHEHSHACRQFVEQIETQKDQNTQLLQDLLSQTCQIQTNFNLENPNMIKQNIFCFLDQISFFNQDLDACSLPQQNNQNIMNGGQDNQNNRGDFKITTDLIMNLVTNKSNFCSNEFIKKLNQSLNRVNPILELSRVDSIFQENKKAIEFEKISESNLKLIEEYVNHQILLKSNQQYENEVKNSLEIKSIDSIFNFKMNFLNSQVIQLLQKTLIDIKPFLKSINFTKIFTDQNKFHFLKSLSDEQVNKIILIAQKGLLQFRIKLVATKFNDGQRDLSIKQREDGEYEIEKLNNNNWVNCISSINLQKEVKYVFRFKVEIIKEDDYFMIGLMRNVNADLNYGFRDNLSSYLVNISDYIVNYNDWGIQNKEKGNRQFSLSRDKLIELRVWLKEQILEVVDYPNYESKLKLEPEQKQKLTQYDDLRLYIGMHFQGSKIILKDAEIVKEFIN